MAEQTYIIARKQSLLDACIQVYGTSKLLFKFAKDNGLQIDSAVNIGDELLYDDELGDQDLKNKIEGEGFIINNPLPSFVSEYKKVYDSFVIKPLFYVASNQNLLVKTLVDAGVWDKLDTFLVLAGHTNANGESLTNWVSPGAFDGIEVNSPVFTALEGFKGDGATSYINSKFIPAIDAINYSLNSAGFGGYSRTNIVEGTYLMAVSEGAGFFRMAIIPSSGGTAFIRINSNPAASIANPNTLGMFIASRLSSVNVGLYLNKIKIINAATASEALAAKPVYIGALNNNGTASNFATRQHSLAFMSAGLSQIEANILTDAFEAYMDSNGKGVIP